MMMIMMIVMVVMMMLACWLAGVLACWVDNTHTQKYIHTDTHTHTVSYGKATTYRALFSLNQAVDVWEEFWCLKHMKHTESWSLGLD